MLPKLSGHGFMYCILTYPAHLWLLCLLWFSRVFICFALLCLSLEFSFSEDEDLVSFVVILSVIIQMWLFDNNLF